MSFTSYAPDFHDVTLWRALGQLAAGRYIDAGSTSNAALGRAFQEQGWQGVHRVADGERIVLDALFDACGPGPVHWLHLAASDLDAGLLDSWQRADLRPWIIVVSSASAVPAAWHRPLEQKGYVLAGRTADTLFYALRTPAAAGLQLAYLPQVAPRAAPQQRDDVTAQVQAERIADLQRQLDTVFASTSWRVTKPLRWAMRLRRSPGPAARELLVASLRKGKALARRTLRATVSQPVVRRIARDLDVRFPALARRLRARLHGIAGRQPAPFTVVPPPADPAGVIGPRFRVLLLDDLAQVATLKGKA